VIYQLNTVVDNLFNRHRRHVNFGLTVEEYMLLYLTTEQYTQLKEVEDIIAPADNHHWATIHSEPDYPGLTLNFNAAATMLWPRNRKIRPDANPEIVARLSAWAVQRARLGQDYARVKAVLDMLNDECPTPQHVRYLWPAALILMAAVKDNYAVDEVARACNEYKAPSVIPNLSVDLRSALKRASSTVVGTQLIGEFEGPTPKYEIEVSLSRREFREPGLGAMQAY
jgi:hypothetical protein